MSVDQHHILVVDDNETNREILTRLLLRRNYRVSEASNGSDALGLIDSTRPGLVLLDIMMPDLDGLETLKKIREQFSAVELPVIMVTARSESSDLVTAFNLGANDFVPKPFEASVLYARVASMLTLTTYHRIIAAELVDSELKYKHLVEESDDLIFSLDSSGRFTSVNASSRRLGYDPAGLLGQKFTDLLHRDRDESPSIVAAFLTERINEIAIGRKMEMPVRLSTRQGEAFEMRLSLQHIELSKPFILGRASAHPEDFVRNCCMTESGKFVITNNLVLTEILSHRITTVASKYLSEDDLAGVRLGLRETLVNAIEHGNLNITYEEKTRATESGNLQALIKQRQEDPLYSNRSVTVDYSADPTLIRFVVTDEGDGFDHEAFRQRTHAPNLSILHGRGLRMTAAMFDRFEFNLKGNCVILEKKVT